MLRGRRVLVGVSGSIASYKAAEVVRGLVKNGADVRVVMTDAATRFVGPATFAALTGHPVETDVFERPERVTHVELGRWAEAYALVGATASTLARLAAGSGEDILCATYLMARCPVLVAPAMHTEMWEHPATQRNVDRVVADGCVLVGPEEGDLASGDFGVGRLGAPEVIVEAVRRALAPQDLAGAPVLVTAGPTREAIDPVRFISNRSSGRMGYALATEALRRGARVVLVTGPVAVEPPWGAEVVRVETAAEMEAECLARLDAAEVVVMCAAVADWTPARTATEKIKKEHAPRALGLRRTTDIAAAVGGRKGERILVAFAAETGDVVSNGRQKLLSKGADLVVANRVGAEGTGFESETNDAVLITSEEAEELPRLEKTELAERVWERIGEIRKKRQRGTG